MKTVSIGIVCFNEEPNIFPAYKELIKVTGKDKKYKYEFVFVDNGSLDKTREEIKKITKKDERVVGVFLSRNFGPEASPQASLDYSTGDAFIMYEGDMQDPAEIILQFIKKWEEGYDVVVGIRTKIEDTPFMTFIRKLYYRIFKTISNIEVPVDAGSFGLLDRKVVNALKQMPEKYRFYRGLRAWVGFKTAYITYSRGKRQRGTTSYNFFKYIKHSERSFFGFSYLPLDAIVYLGLFLVLVSCVWIVGILITFFSGQIIQGSTLILLSIISFGGVQLLALSIIGKYIQVIVDETKARPVYLIEEVINQRGLKYKVEK